MRFPAGALVAALAYAGPATAADVIAASFAPAPTLWSGLYLGPVVGVGWANPALAGVNSSSMSGALGGGEIGYNFQFGGNFVIGVEGDGVFTDIDKSINLPALGSPPELYTANGLASLRARAGLAWGNFLLYGTLGAGWGHGAITSTGAIATAYPLNAEVWHFGWAGGAGVEWAVMPRWSIKLEYLHFELGDATYTGITTGSINADTVRFGVNFQFQ
jgi:outer membrane immunogenic protein